MTTPAAVPPTTGACYLNYPRAVLNTPHPMYGDIGPGFGVGDLPQSYQAGVPVFNAISANATSAAIPIDANAIEMTAAFSDLHTSCSLSVCLADGVTQIAEFDGVSTLNADNLFVGFAEQRVVIGGGSLIFKVTNYSGTGTFSLSVRRTG